MAIQRISSGGVVFRLDGAGREAVQVALIRVTRSVGHAWTLPKGWVEPGEDLDQTAVREVREETGLHARVLRKLGEVTYEFYAKAERSRIQKTVHLFLLECLGGDMSDHDDEVEEARWFPLAEAVQALTYANERTVLEQAVSFIQGGGQSA